MSIRTIIPIPDPLLRKVSKPVEQIDDRVVRLLDDMLETMYDAPGVGLAGVQIAVPLRIVTLDVAEREFREEVDENGETKRLDTIEKKPMFMINPQIVAYSDEMSVQEEGCLSIPEYFAEIERPARCTVKFLDREGKAQTIEADGILSTVIQHEVDHLDGKLFIDQLSSLKRNIIIRKFTKIARQDGIKPAKAVFA